MVIYSMSERTNLFDDLEIDNLPNRLTIFRVLLIPIVLFLLHLASSDSSLDPASKINFGWYAAWLFFIASITDFFDGYIARKKNIVTVFGSFLDPIADKFLTVSSLIMLGSINRINSAIVIILVLREMYMTSLRLLASSEGVSVPVNMLGKWKTLTMMAGIPLLMAHEAWSLFPTIPMSLVGSILVYLAGIISLWSAIVYTYNMVQKLKQLRIKKLEDKKTQVEK